MKRLIAAVSFTVLASPVFATPFEQNELDRQLPAVNNPMVSSGEEGTRYAAMAGSTRSDREIAAEGSAESSFANDHNFIAPPL